VRSVRAVTLRTDRLNGVCKVVARAGRPRNPYSISDSDMSFFFSSPKRAERMWVCHNCYSVDIFEMVSAGNKAAGA
jgi:hypothetical protein